MPYTETELSRDCEVLEIPYGTRVTIPAGTPVMITQALGDTYTIQVPTMGGLYRVAGKDADALGQEPSGKPNEQASAITAAEEPVDEQLVWNELRGVYDPEIPVNIVELGLVYDLKIEELPGGGSRVEIRMTLTAPGCGMGPVIAMDAKTRVQGIPGVVEADVQIVFDPPWNQQMMSEAAKLELGLL